MTPVSTSRYFTDKTKIDKVALVCRSVEFFNFIIFLLNFKQSEEYIGFTQISVCVHFFLCFYIISDKEMFESSTLWVVSDSKFDVDCTFGRSFFETFLIIKASIIGTNATNLQIRIRIVLFCTRNRYL